MKFACLKSLFKVSKRVTRTVSMALYEHERSILNDMISDVFKINKKVA